MASDTSGIDWELVGYVAASDYRTRVLAALADDPATPTTISERSDLDVTHVSRSLRELRERGVVELLVPEERSKGRIYGLTDDGAAIASKAEEVDA
ncbi:winged helix-turn-helix domain-containing protein [Halobacterium sp. CBA1126]|uniref:winged helix-turn-helix domain-containing protein n=1 Tax=Halobacterium sp. CBA1126 TaxID=2668074 RepID=UPI0012F833EB|nr:winged helix-turn-helix domain-containing protein [Halobacterium sp. CBA1126]MUV60013.1 helix-turn-helix domain-containing protein [Halobacterium sp. CBA1126]